MRMVEFLIHSSGVTPEGWYHLNQRMPSGQIVYGPKYVPIMDRPYMKGYRTHPELTSRGTLPYYAAGAFVAATGVYLVSLPFTVATAQYPLIAGPQYQSAMSGQLGIGSSALNMRKPQSLTELFSWEYWRGY